MYIIKKKRNKEPTNLFLDNNYLDCCRKKNRTKNKQQSNNHY